MKRLLFAITFALCLFSCSSDDDKDVLVEIPFDDPNLIGYTRYLSGDIALFLTYNFVVDAKCPNISYGHYDDDYLTDSPLPNEDWSYTIYCQTCGAQYRSDNGKSKNDIAKGTRLRTYKFDYERATGWVVYK